MDTIIEKALQSQSFVWIDMESSEYADNTFKVYLNLFEKYERLGIVIQSNLKRTQSDLEMLLKKGAKIRLVKGHIMRVQKTHTKQDMRLMKITRN